MERQRSFIIKPTRLFLLSLTISFSLLFSFLFSFWVFKITPSVSSNETNLRFFSGFSAIKAQTFIAFTSNFSVNGRKGSTSRGTHFLQAADSPREALSPRNEWNGDLESSEVEEFSDFPSNISVSKSEDPILGGNNFAEAADSPEKALGLSDELKDGILGDAQVRTSVGSYGEVLSSVGEKDSILNHTHIRRDRDSSEKGLDSVGEEKTFDSDVPKLSDEKFQSINLMSNVSSNAASATAGEIEKESACDVSEGKWVFDEAYPLYTSNSCPFIDEGFSCEANGRLDGDYKKWRWQAHQCNIPRFSPLKMLELIRGKRLVFVGDSINRNQWESMLCMLGAAISDPSRVYEARGRRITKERGNYNFKFIDYQCSVEYYLSHFLVRESKARIGQKRKQTLRIDAIDRSSSRWRGADILVFNSAHWWSHYKTKAGLNYYQEGDYVHSHLDANIAYKRALITWASWVDKYINPTKTQVFFRSSAPSHFSGGEWNAGGHCRESTQPLNYTHTRKAPERNLIVEEVVKQMRTPVTILNITSLSGFRIDGHPSVFGRKPENGKPSRIEDCSHWCLPGVPDTWNELLYFYLLSGKRLISTG